MPKAEPTVIKVRLSHVFNGYGKTVPFSNYYECTGPDGRRFDNKNKATLISVLKRIYGPVILEITDVRRPVNEY